MSSKFSAFGFSVVSLLLLVAGCTSPVAPGGSNGDGVHVADPDHEESREPQKHAVLVGCTTYDNLPWFANLRGPNNDVVMMKKMLVDRFEFPEDNIDTLADLDDGATARPTEENIAWRIENIVDQVEANDQVVIYLSGHGSQQPDDDPDNEQDPEPDGLDEVFLPADVRDSIEDNQIVIKNAITDDRFGKWINEIREKKASVWFIVDACHSGTLTRGSRTYRQVAPEHLLSREVLAKAKNRPATRGALQANHADGMADDEGGVVALYASQPHEPTFEANMPIGDTDGEFCGVLTYHLVKVISSSSEAITYDEVAKRVHAEYVAAGLTGPLPMVEGSDRHREVLGAKQWQNSSRFQLLHERNSLRLNSGSLHGLTKGSILAVYPPAGESGEKEVVGHVKVVRVYPSGAVLETCAFEDHAEVEELLKGGQCEVVYVNYGDLHLKVAIAPSTDDAPKLDAEIAGKLEQSIKSYSEQQNTIVQFVDEAERADWLLIPIDDQKIALASSQGWDEDTHRQAFGPVAVDDDIGSWLDERLNRIARATNLLKVAAKTSSHQQWSALASLFGSKRTGIRAELLRLEDKDDKAGTPVERQANGIVLKNGELVSVRVHNRGNDRVDASLLFIDSGYGIHSVYPTPGTVVDNRIEAGESLTIGPLQVEDTSLGQEHLVVIAVASKGQPLEFSWLAQESIEQVATRSSQAKSLESPIGELLQNAMFASGTTRGYGTIDAKDVSVRVLTWQTEK